VRQSESEFDHSTKKAERRSAPLFVLSRDG
jgi:hypothetical protein